MLSEGPLAFSVELVDASKLADGESGNRDCLQMSDARALYRGVFWQVNNNPTRGIMQNMAVI